MALQKTSVPINFSKGIDTKSDDKQVQIGSFLSLENSVFTKQGLLQKRNGYKALTPLPDATSTKLTTFNDNLIAIGQNLQALSADTNKWYNKGPIQPLELAVTPMVRSNSGQLSQDTAVAANGLACTVWFDSSTTSYYRIVDSVTGSIIINNTALLASAGAINGPKVWVLGNHFIIVYQRTVTATPHLQYITIPINNPANPSVAADLSTTINSITSPFDGHIANNNLYIAYAGTATTLKITYIDSTLLQHNTVSVASRTVDLVNVTSDDSQSTPVIYVTYYDNGSTLLATRAYSSSLVLIGSEITLDAATGTLLHITGAANNMLLTVFYEEQNTYSYAPNAASNFINKITTTEGGTVGSPSIILRSVGIAAKAFYFSPNDDIYLIATYGGAFQPTYFLIDQDGNIISKLAYANGVGYLSSILLPNINIDGATIKFGYLFKDLTTSINKSQGASIAGIYSQLGVNLASYTFNNNKMSDAEIGSSLHLAGGILWQYDGVKPVEHGFHVWPEDITVAVSHSGGSMTTQDYFYVATYEWTDAAGNIHRSAPSVPVQAHTADFSGSSNSVTVNVPYLRLTYKTPPNPARIVIYRWSTAQQTYYQVTSVTAPQTNSTTSDSLAYVDTQADSAIIGNTILYTTGGVVENIGAPACNDLNLYKTRLFLIDAEDPNLLWYSKQTIQGTPVEMNDLFTIYLAPTVGAQGSTGSTKVIAALDDKNIFFKPNAIYYNTGNGPDNTGANNDFSEPVFITATVGCSNPDSVVFIPQGLMFQSDKGIWLLGRDLSTNYIGAPAESFTQNAIVQSAVNIPGTNQVRFTLDSGVTLMYDYYYNQWGTFVNVPAISSTLYQGLHTYLNSYGNVFQENPGSYLDGSKPVLMEFETSWFNLAGLQGFERAYFFYLLATYISPHRLNINISYDYASAPSQTLTITPDNNNPNWGDEALWGSGALWGGISAIEQWRIFFQNQKVQAFKIEIQELFDASLGIPAGAGFTMSGLNIIAGMKKGYPVLKASRSAG